jgi:hypothetical protein
MDANGCKNDLQKYCCETCDYNTSRKSSFNKHNLSAKHLNRTNSKNLEQKICEPNTYSCKNCNKVYKARNSLWYHEQKCKPLDNEILPSADADLKILVIDLIKSNQILQQQMLEVCKNGINTTNNNNINNNNHSNNKTFNLQFFLNEQCKDAMNIMDFVDTIQLKISDMERIGELGYVEGISNIIMENLNEMDIYKRPIHCSDAKREIMHIKDNNVWQKDTANNDKMRKAIKHITWLNSKLLFAWAADHPGVIYSDHKLNDKYSEMILEAMGGKRNKTMEEGEAKIIKKISKLVLIDKSL